MTAAAMAEFIGRTAIFPLGGMNVTIKITDCRERFGNLDFLIVPLEGSGSKWVTETSVRIVE